MSKRPHRIALVLFTTLAAGCLDIEEPALDSEPAELVIPSQPTTLVRQGSNKCLDVNGAGTANGTKIQQWTCNGTGAQLFAIEDRGGGNYRFRNPQSNKCLDVTSGGTTNGTKIQLWSCSNTSGNQKFRFEELADGRVRLRHPGSNKCVDVNGASDADGAQVQLWSCNNTAAQAWSLGGSAPPPPPPPPPGLVWRDANLTWFTSYPDPGSEECIEYNGCMWAGYFAFVDGQKPESWVASHNIAAVHSDDAGAYALKTLRVRQGIHEIDVVVYDMCSDSDCDGCCTQNSSSTGFLIDLESYTRDRFGSGSGIVQWACLDC